MVARDSFGSEAEFVAALESLLSQAGRDGIDVADRAFSVPSEDGDTDRLEVLITRVDPG